MRYLVVFSLIYLAIVKAASYAVNYIFIITFLQICLILLDKIRY